MRQADQKTSRFDIQLTPDGLGRVDVAVEIDAAGKVTAALAFEKPEAAALVKDHMGELQAALASAGLSLTPEALKISHVGADGFAAATTAGPGQQGVAASAASLADNSPGQGGGSQGQSFTAGAHAFQSGQQGSGQPGAGHGQDQPGQQARASFGGARSFEAASAAAEGVDRRAAYGAGLSARGLDIRI